MLATKCVCFVGTSSFRKMAEVGMFQRLPEWEPAQRIPVGGNELVTVQLVQQVNNVHYTNILQLAYVSELAENVKNIKTKYICICSLTIIIINQI